MSHPIAFDRGSTILKVQSNNKLKSPPFYGRNERDKTIIFRIFLTVCFISANVSY